MNKSIMLILFALVGFQANLFAKNSCNALVQSISVEQTNNQATQQDNDSYLRPTRSQLKQAAVARLVQHRLSGTTAQQRKTIVVPEFRGFVSELLVKLKQLRAQTPRHNLLLQYQLNSLIVQAYYMLKMNLTTYPKVISLTLNASKVATNRIYNREGKGRYSLIKELPIYSQLKELPLMRKISWYFLLKQNTLALERRLNEIINSNDQFLIPTMRELAFEDFLLINNLNVGYLCFTTERQTFDGIVNGAPINFTQHDIGHLGNLALHTTETSRDSQIFTRKALAIAAHQPKQTRLAMSFILFYLSHERGKILNTETLNDKENESAILWASKNRSSDDDLGYFPELKDVLSNEELVLEALDILKNI